MSLTKLSLGGNNDVIYKLFPPRESLVTSRLGKVISKSFFYSVDRRRSTFLMRVTTVSWLAFVTSFPLISSKKSPFLLLRLTLPSSN
jgi:hypothetical protein